MKMSFRLGLLAATLIAGVACNMPGAVAQTPADSFFPFVIPWDDRVVGSQVDVSFLNAKPAGVNGPIVVRDGQFVESKTGRRVRFLGVNIHDRTAFPPTKAEADKIAKRMAALGINVVRWHHIPNGWNLDGGTIWKRDKLYLEMDPVQLDRLDYLFFALKREGIYSNFNLQTSRNYIPEQGLPASVTQIPFGFGKRVDKFYQPMIEVQKKHARDWLGRVNPYTGMRYADDPAVMVLEINNENSLVGSPWEGLGGGLDGLPEPFRGDLMRQWNEWLKQRYTDDAGLQRAWAAAASEIGPDLVKPGSAWTFENQSNSDATFTPAAGSGDGSAAIKVTINSHNGPNWHIQIHQPGLNLENGKVYTVRFRGRSSQRTTVGVNSTLDKADWRNVGLGSSVTLTPEWQDYALSFRANSVEPNHVRVAFILGEARGTLEFDSLRVNEGAIGSGVPAGQTLARMNVGFPPAELSPKSRDWIAFLTEVEVNFGKQMRDFMRNELGFKNALMIDSQISWGGTTGWVREAAADFADDHAYWNHPTFLGSDWDPENYRVDRNSMVRQIANSGGFGALTGSALYRVAGKPFTLSEYNHPAPSDYQAEMMPMFAAFGAAQGWDILYAFDYGETVEGPNDAYGGYFDVAKNPAKMAFFPATALLFRLGLIEPHAITWTLTVPAEPWTEALSAGEAWTRVDESPNLLGVRTQVKLGDALRVDKQMPTSMGESALSIQGSENPVFVGSSDSAVALTGFVRGQTVATSAGTFTFPAGGVEHASVMLATVDGKSIAESDRVLLAVVGRAENTGMAWNEERTSVGTGWGTGPVLVERVPMSVDLKADGARTVYLLDASGKRSGKLPSTFERGRLKFSINSGVRTAWLEIVKE